MFTSCNEITSGNKQFEFYYYPSRNVYYNVAANQYTYSINGGKTWNTFKPKNNMQPATLGSRQIVYSDDEQPWKLNELHRKQYNGKLISLEDADTVTQAGFVTEKKITVKKPKLNVEEPKKEEKKPGFFKRLFGGKKKNNNNSNSNEN